jgi:hypothetical protein
VSHSGRLHHPCKLEYGKPNTVSSTLTASTIRTIDAIHNLVHNYHCNRGDPGGDDCKGAWRFPGSSGGVLESVGNSAVSSGKSGVRNCNIPVLQETARFNLKVLNLGGEIGRRTRGLGISLYSEN